MSEQQQENIRGLTEQVVVDTRVARVRIINLRKASVQGRARPTATHIMTLFDLPIRLGNRPRPYPRTLTILQYVPLLTLGQPEKHGNTILEEHNLCHPARRHGIAVPSTPTTTFSAFPFCDEVCARGGSLRVGFRGERVGSDGGRFIGLGVDRRETGFNRVARGETDGVRLSFRRRRLARTGDILTCAKRLVDIGRDFPRLTLEVVV